MTTKPHGIQTPLGVFEGAPYMPDNPFGARDRLTYAGGQVALYRLDAVERQGLGQIQRLPYSVRVLLENALRASARGQDPELACRLAAWRSGAAARDMAFWPGRVLLQDLTGVPLVVDLAALRAAIAEHGGDPRWAEPQVPVDLVIDHSVHVDAFGSASAFAFNVELEYRRNRERYALLRWAQSAFRDFRVVPPGTGIVHQVNLEYLGSVVSVSERDGARVAAPDTLVGTDSHTTMINGIGVLGWGVGGIEAEAVMCGEPYAMTVPDVVGFRLDGQLPAGSTATDLVLTVTQMLRRHGVVGKFVEFYGPGLSRLPVPDRATIANMAPEYGATVGFFPVDAQTLGYLRMTGRSAEQVDLVERYCKTQGLFREDGAPEPEYGLGLTLNLDTVEPSLAGPGRPEDRLGLGEVRESFRRAYPSALPTAEGSGRGGASGPAIALVTRERVQSGAVAIAAITSCTNTSNPGVMVAAGLLAQRAVARGLKVPSYVKTSLAPGSRVVSDYLKAAGLMEPLEALGFAVVGYGCTTCIGNSGELTPEATGAVQSEGAVVAAVLSGNRNFRGRVNALVRANYLASPPLVVAYALAGTVDIDLEQEPLGEGADGRPVYLRDLWPGPDEVRAAIAAAISPEMFRRQYARVFEGDERWRALPVPTGETFTWDDASTYIRKPPFITPPAELGRPFRGGRVLAFFGDSITTDDISPAGEISPRGDAAAYLGGHGVQSADFNTYGARRGNHEVMMRGTFGNIRLRNRLVPDLEGPNTLLLPEGEQISVFEAAERYRQRGTPLLVIAGQMYGNGSSRDWAAKGPMLLGVRAVIAQSYERIHRANLIGMGVLPLQFAQGESAASLGLTGREEYALDWEGEIAPGHTVEVSALAEDGGTVRFSVRARIDTPVEVEYLKSGGILPRTLRRILERGAQTA